MIVVTAFALISMMFLLMVRVTDPLMPRAMFGVLNTLLYFPSGAVYPQQGFPGWMQVIAVVDPFTYAVHAFKSLLLKNTGFGAIACDLLFLAGLLRRRDEPGGAALQADAVTDANASPGERPGHAGAPARGGDAAVRRRAASSTSRSATSAARRTPTSPRSTITSATSSGCIARSAGRHRRCCGNDDRAARPRPPARRRRSCARTFAFITERLVGSTGHEWLQRFIAREMADPTPALASLVDQGLRPRLEYLGRIIAEILELPTDDPRVLECVTSTHAQILMFRDNPITHRLRARAKLRAATPEEIADHITMFSLAGIRAISDRATATAGPAR